jgi:hypothetical protein
MSIELNPERHFVFALSTKLGQDEKNEQNTEPDQTEEVSIEQVHPLEQAHITGEHGIYDNSGDIFGTGGF